jgi:hypothetical protein
MQVRMTATMIEALKSMPESPDNLVRCVAGARKDGDALSVDLNQDEAMAMTEMCQWHIKKDPESDKLDPKAEVFDAIVRAIYQAQDA